jgi:peroxiredoxin
MKLAASLVVFTSLLAAGNAALAAAVPGQPAPAFKGTDVNGKPVSLADFKGKYVVLEWNNPSCPFVMKHYDSGNMQALQKRYGADNVAWVAVNSTSDMHSEYMTPEKLAAWFRQQNAAPAAVLVDSKGEIARAYGAKVTPHMFVIDPKGTVVYAGAIDDKRSAREADRKTANNYVRAALAEATAGKPVTLASTTPYGCSVKY